MKTLFFVLALSLSAASAQAAQAAQVCRLVEDFDDWRLTFDFAAGKVNFFDNDREVTGTYQYTLEMVGGADVFVSDDASDPWTAIYYGDRNGNGNGAKLSIGEKSYEFTCSKE